eukprot:4777714-Pyramimonas_sp.AAC.1
MLVCLAKAEGDGDGRKQSVLMMVATCVGAVQRSDEDDDGGVERKVQWRRTMAQHSFMLIVAMEM